MKIALLIYPYRYCLLMWAMACIVTACGSSKKATIKTVAVPVVYDTISYQKFSSSALIDSMQRNSFAAHTLSAKTDVSIVGVDDKKEFNATIRIVSDSAIWISINAILGVEVARVLITPDSIFVMDRLNKTYDAEDYKYLNDLLKLKVDFITVQNILVGNFFQYRNENKFNSVYIEDKGYILSTLNKRKLKRSLEDKDPNKPIIQDFYVDATTFRIQQLQIIDDKLNKSLTTDYSNYQATAAGLFPYLVNTQVSAEKKLTINITYNKVTVNSAVEMPYTIPGSYKLMPRN